MGDLEFLGRMVLALTVTVYVAGAVGLLVFILAGVFVVVAG